MPSCQTRRSQRGGGGPSDKKIEELKAAVEAAAKEQAAYAATHEEKAAMYQKAKYIEGQVSYDGSIWAKSLATATGLNERRPVFFNPGNPTGLELECDINPGMFSGKYNYTIRGSDGGTLKLALEKAKAWNLDKGALSLSGVTAGAARAATLPVSLPVGFLAGAAIGVGTAIATAMGKNDDPLNSNVSPLAKGAITGAMAGTAIGLAPVAITYRNNSNIISKQAAKSGGTRRRYRH